MTAINLMSAIFIGVFAYPAYSAVIKLVGRKKGCGLIMSLGIFALSFEYVALKTGWPYGGFSYGEMLGPKLGGMVPVPVAWAWAPMVIGVCAVAARLVTPKYVIPVALILLILVDMVVDPGAVATRVWAYAPVGWFYGVPVSNFLGWIVSGLIGIFITYQWIRPHQFLKSRAENSLGLILICWTLVGLVYRLWIPVAIGAVLLIGYNRLWLKKQL